MTSAVIEDKCAFCKSTHLTTLVPQDALPCHVNVLKCRPCDLVFLESRSRDNGLDPEETAYWDKDEQKKIYLQEKVQKIFRAEFTGRMESIERHARLKRELLDVGCGVGHFLEIAKKRGWDVRGLDISHAASNTAKELYGHEVAVGTLENAPFRDGEFNVITLWDVIEHIRRPVENVRAANRLLQKGGLLVMKTPNEAGLFKWLARTAFRLLGKRASFLLKYVYYIPHYFSYSKRSMNRLLRLNGFEPIRYELDDTSMEFATEKIHVHYKKDPKRRFVIACLPFVIAVARALRMNNKMTVYAKKVRNV